MKNANCFGKKDWATALSNVANLSSGSCGLTDGSKAGDWRLSNVGELQALTNETENWKDRFLSNTAGTGKWSEGDPFTGVQLSTPEDFQQGLGTGYWTAQNRCKLINDCEAEIMGMPYWGKYVPTTEQHYVWPFRQKFNY
ncbi:hypothetical protein [Candidatus Parabeggiatoa sp. HSG14]|uniref:hypothetical protein n=1 Tax=Candidatus Parabeggiatoa sp. HSG14 TaxID=3055593 RepID=UPI0025A6D13C|nr:hypothetical protein [Thiotrichales bacterium HSG14]